MVPIHNQAHDVIKVSKVNFLAFIDRTVSEGLLFNFLSIRRFNPESAEFLKIY